MLKKAGTSTPFKKTTRILRRDKRTERNILPPISIKEVEPSTYENVGHQINRHSYSNREHTSVGGICLSEGMHTQSPNMLS